MIGKYEYLVVAWDVFMEVSLQIFINNYANEGWELVTMTGDDFKTITFRREQ